MSLPRDPHIWRRLSNILLFVQTAEPALACSCKVVIFLWTYMVIKLDLYGHEALYSRTPYHSTQANRVRFGKQLKFCNFYPKQLNRLLQLLNSTLSLTPPPSLIYQFFLHLNMQKLDRDI